ncbi:MAG TPA: hypothetical protein VF629_07180 [Hymenobacter sp.]|jgi:hypothetical protein|uniref:hypothetical protein n=1 Tax=Hymenobacter sp. TaxID=1898978 RepID=UPI002ED871AB
MKITAREILWLVAALLVSIPLAWGLNEFLESDYTIPDVTNILHSSSEGSSGTAVLTADEAGSSAPAINFNQLILLYCLSVVGCYVARFSSAGARLLVDKLPEDL